MLVLEEAHTFIHRTKEGDESLSSPDQMCRRTFERIAREGRKFGLDLSFPLSGHPNFRKPFSRSATHFCCTALSTTVTKRWYESWSRTISAACSANCRHYRHAKPSCSAGRLRFPSWLRCATYRS